MSWQTVRAATLRVGDVLPVGPVTELDYFGPLRLVAIVANGETFTRSFDDLVDRAAP